MTKNEIENYSWGEYDFSQRNVRVLDTSLRDGEQSGVILLPSLEEEEKFVDKLVELGINAIDLTTPVSRGMKLRNAITLAKRLPSHVDVVCLARTHARDITAALELQERAKRTIKGIIFVGSSNKRLDAENWNINEILDWMGENVTLAARNGMVPIVATEHTTETDAEVIEKIFKTGLEAGRNNGSGQVEACIADTTGIASERGVRKLVRYFRDIVLKDYGNVPLHWHGHDDFGLSVANSLAAIDEGADVIHVTTLGIGERSGNTPLEQILLNLKRFGDPQRQDLRKLLDFANYTSHIFGTPLRSNYPGLGLNNRRFASGIHGSAVRKARLKGLPNPYEGVPQEWVNEVIKVVVGPVAGEDNAREVLELDEGIESPTLESIKALLEVAMRLNKILSPEEVHSVVQNTMEVNGNNGHS